MKIWRKGFNPVRTTANMKQMWQRSVESTVKTGKTGLEYTENVVKFEDDSMKSLELW